MREIEQTSRGFAGVERGVRIDAARHLEHGRASLRTLLVHQPLGPVEPASGNAGECRQLLRIEPDSMMAEPLAHGALGEALERHELAA